MCLEKKEDKLLEPKTITFKVIKIKLAHKHTECIKHIDSRTLILQSVQNVYSVFPGSYFLL